jgi:predicted component of type VI protein secretion system
MLFCSSHTTPGLTFAMVLRSNTQQRQQQQPQLPQQPQQPSVAQACTARVGDLSAPPPLSHEQQQLPSQLDQAPNAISSSVNDMLKVVATVVQQIMTELIGAESEEDRIMAITKIVLNLMK